MGYDLSILIGTNIIRGLGESFYVPRVLNAVRSYRGYEHAVRSDLICYAIIIPKCYMPCLPCDPYKAHVNTSPELHVYSILTV